ncbi:MAG: helix-turn-helix domain-containing protein [Candidatus Cyclobacteriaceae bacterium M3_2C_046]
MYSIYDYPLEDTSKHIIHSIWIVQNGMKGIRQSMVCLAPLGYPYIHVKAGKVNRITYEHRLYKMNAYLAGQTQVPTYFNFALDMDAVFIRLQPWGLKFFTVQSVHSYTGAYWPLSVLQKDLSPAIREIITSETTDWHKGQAIEQLLLHHVHPLELEQRIITSLQLIKNNCGKVKIEDLADQINVSCRRFQQLCLHHIGLSPKKMAKIYRLHRIIYDVVNQQYPSSLYDYHYDQAHFIRDFKRMTHMSLKKFKLAVFTEEEKLAVLRTNLYLEQEELKALY